MWLLIQVANVPINDKRLKNIHLCLFMIPMCNQGKKKVLTLVCLQSQIIQNIEVPLSLAHLKKDAETLFWPQMTQFWLQLPSRQWHDLRNLGHARITSSRPRHCREGRTDEACDVFATNANVPGDGEGHHAVEKAANLQWVGESVASERIPSMWESWSEECGDEVWRGTLPCSANLSQGMVTHIGMAIDTLFCKEPEVTNWSKTKNALTRLGLNTKLQDSKRWAIDRDRPSRILCHFF